MAAEIDTSRGAPPFELSVDGFPEGAFHVHSFTGEEKLSEAYLRHVQAAFQTRMQFDPRMRTQFEALVGRTRSMSMKRDA